MKYTLNCYGWSGEFIAKEVTDEQLAKIKTLMEENDAEDVSEVRWGIQENEILDIWSGDIFHMTKPLQTGDMLFQLEDEDGNIVLEFNITETQSVEDVIEDFDDYNVYDLITDENRHIYFSVDENKGGIYQFEIESDTLPTAEDFACASGNIETPESEWDFIDGIYFRGEKLEPTDYLDNTGKAATVNLFEHES
jgi:hypothetical protein